MIKYKRLPLETLCNARDLGGFAADGGVTRYGVFVRSEVPAKLNSADIEFLKSYGVTTSLDLRGPDEAERTPSLLSKVEGHNYILCPMMDENASKASDGKAPPPKEGKPADPAFFDIEWSPVYIAITERGKGWVKKVFELAAEGEGCVLYHCFTGKDRTGMFSAMLLGVCGVDKLDIMSDYSLSMTCLRPFYAELPDGPYFTDSEGRPDYSRGFYRTAPETMERLIEHWEKNYGSITGYVKNCGVSDETIGRIREKLIEKI